MTQEMSGQGDCVTRELLANGILQAAEAVSGILDEAKAFAAASIEEFVSKKLGILGGALGIYCKLFKSVNVHTKEQFEHLIRRHYRYEVIRDNHEYLLETEDSWDAFLTSTAAKEQMAALGGEVVVVSFGVRRGALRWLQDTKCSFPMVLDSERMIYHSIGLKCSFSQVWSISTIVYYAEQMTYRNVPQPYKDISDDPYQLGGDLILDAEGRIRFLYCSKAPPDRPAIDDMLTAMKKEKTSLAGNSQVLTGISASLGNVE